MNEINTLEELFKRMAELDKEMSKLTEVAEQILAKLDKLDSIDEGIKLLHQATKSGFKGVHDALGTWDRVGLPAEEDTEIRG